MTAGGEGFWGSKRKKPRVRVTAEHGKIKNIRGKGREFLKAGKWQREKSRRLGLWVQKSNERKGGDRRAGEKGKKKRTAEGKKNSGELGEKRVAGKSGQKLREKRELAVGKENGELGGTRAVKERETEPRKGRRKTGSKRKTWSKENQQGSREKLHGFQRVGRENNRGRENGSDGWGLRDRVRVGDRNQRVCVTAKESR